MRNEGGDEQHARTQSPQVWRRPEGPEGLAVVCVGGGGHGRGAGGWRQGQGGPRDRPLRAVRLACGDLAGGPPPTGTQSDQTELGRSCAVDGGRAERSSRRGR